VLPICCNIYALYNQIKEEKRRGAETTTKGLLLTSKSTEISNSDKELLRTTKIVRTYLVFDLDLQDSGKTITEKMNIVKEMISMFNDETDDLGKIFINYPMMESIRHLDFDNPISLKDKKIHSAEFTKYKEVVGKEGTQKKSYSLSDFFKIAKAHCMKANFILNGKFEKPSDYNKISADDIHKKQHASIDKNGCVSVVNCSSLLYFELHPSKEKIFKAQWA